MHILNLKQMFTLQMVSSKVENSKTNNSFPPILCNFIDICLMLMYFRSIYYYNSHFILFERNIFKFLAYCIPVLVILINEDLSFFYSFSHF